MERRRMHGFVDAVARIIGRDAAQELATDIANAPPEAQQLTPWAEKGGTSKILPFSQTL